MKQPPGQTRGNWRFPRLILEVTGKNEGQAGQEQLLRYTGSCAGTWTQATCRAAQGCPLSPIIAPGLPGLRLLVALRSMAYLSRTIGPCSRDHGCAMSAACQRSRAFHANFCLTRDASKSSVVSGEECVDLAAELGHACVSQLSLLGVDLSVEGAVVPDEVHPCCHSGPEIGSGSYWTAGFALPFSEALMTLTNSVRHALQASLTFESPPVLFRETCD